MICIHLKNNNPFFCLASEEYFLKNFQDDIFMLWQSDNTVVVGKHQNALAEINYPFVRENNIIVARRISGGGTVFHDSGNVNFAFIKNVKSPSEISFSLFTKPVVDALAKLGLKATTSGRNDLMVDGLKISGNAEHVFKNRVLHHGTLLFNSDLKKLSKAIKVIPGKYESKAVQSNSSKVVNISDFMDLEMKTEEFIKFLLELQLKKEGNSLYIPGKNDNNRIQDLVAKKFNTWEWQYGYSPKYKFSNEIAIGDKKIIVNMEVKKGFILDCSIKGDYFSESKAKHLSHKMISARHIYDDVKSALINSELDYNDNLVSLFF